MASLINTIKTRLLTAFPRLLAHSAKKVEALKIEGVDFSKTPWTSFRAGLKNSTVAIITTGGFHLKTDKPFNMADPTGDPTFRVIPSDASSGELTITHDYYDHRDADRDRNVVFPIDRLGELASEGFIGAVAKHHYSFMGHITGKHVLTLMNETAPKVAELLKADSVDCVIFTPG